MGSFIVVWYLNTSLMVMLLFLENSSVVSRKKPLPSLLTYLGRFWCRVCLGSACSSFTIAKAIGTLNTSSSLAMLPRAFLWRSSLSTYKRNQQKLFLTFIWSWYIFCENWISSFFHLSANSLPRSTSWPKPIIFVSAGIWKFIKKYTSGKKKLLFTHSMFFFFFPLKKLMVIFKPV